MAARRIRTTVAANAVVTNVLAGEVLEFPGVPSEVEVAITGSATGLEADVQFGSDLVLERGDVPVEAVANQGPLLPDNLIVSDVATASDRLIIRLTNTTAGALVAISYIRVTPV